MSLHVAGEAAGAWGQMASADLAFDLLQIGPAARPVVLGELLHGDPPEVGVDGVEGLSVLDRASVDQRTESAGRPQRVPALESARRDPVGLQLAVIHPAHQHPVDGPLEADDLAHRGIPGGEAEPELRPERGERLPLLGKLGQAVAESGSALQDALLLEERLVLNGQLELPGTGHTVATDLGSGALVDLAAYGLPREPLPQEKLAAGCDIVSFSGDKLLGGPQAGILVGRAAAIAAIRSHPLMRALRPDKLTLAALCATLALYRDGRDREVPVVARLEVDPATLRARAEALAAAIAAAGGPAVANTRSAAMRCSGRASKWWWPASATGWTPRPWSTCSTKAPAAAGSRRRTTTSASSTVRSVTPSSWA